MTVRLYADGKTHYPMSEGRLVLVNPPRTTNKVKKMPAKKRVTKRSARKSVRRGGTKASRSAAAKKAAATRKRNAAKRSSAAKKAAATRKRNAAKRFSAAKKAAATRKKSTKRASTRKATKRGPSKTKRSAAAKKGWRTRRAKATKRSNAAKRSARSRKAKTVRRKSTKRTAAKRTSSKRKTTRMTKAKRSAAAKKGWRTRRATGTKRRTTKRKAKRRTSRSAKFTTGSVKGSDFLGFLPSKINLKGVQEGFMGVPGALISDSGNLMKGLAYSSFAGFMMMGLTGAMRNNIPYVSDMIGNNVTGPAISAAGGLGNGDGGVLLDTAIDLAFLSGLSTVASKGFGVDTKFVKAGAGVAGVFIVADMIRNLQTLSIGQNASALAAGDYAALGMPSVPFLSGTGGGLGSLTNDMFGMHSNNMLMAGGHDMGMMHGAHVTNNLALAMASNNTAAHSNNKFFGTKSLGSTRVNLF